MPLVTTATTQAISTRTAGSGPCKICSHPDREAIHRAIAEGSSVITIALKYAGQFSRHTLHRHLSDCINSTQQRRKEELAYDSTFDLNQHLAALMTEGEDALIAAKKVLLVDGDLCFDPRAWEINVVYLDHDDRNEQGEPKLKSARLSKLLAKISEAGKEPQHSYIKSEDMRKTFRDCIEVIGSLVDRVAKLTGAYKNVDDKTDRLNYLRDTIQKAAVKFGTTYEHELGVFLEDHAHGIRPDLKRELEREHRGMGGDRGMRPVRSPVSSAPLAAAGGEVKELPPSPTSSPGVSEVKSNVTKIPKEVPGLTMPYTPASIEVEVIPQKETPIKLGEFFPETITNQK